MDIGMRVMQQINISTSLTLVRFLSVGLNPVMSMLDTCIMSLLVLMVSYVTGSKHILNTLSRRLAILLILEESRPLLLETASGQRTVHIRGLMVNTGVISILAVVPPSWKQSQEAQVLISSIMFMYADILLFLTAWGDLHLGLLVASLVFSYLINVFSSKGPSNTILYTSLQIVSTALSSLVLKIITMHIERRSDAAVLQLVLLFTLAHCVTIPVIHQSEDYMLYKISLILQGFITSDPWLWCGFLLLLSRFLAQWIGLEAWATRIAILVLVNITVAMTITYIQRLAVYDTIVTLKSSALIVQFVLHELSVLTFT
jgi:hypothetical protein